MQGDIPNRGENAMRCGHNLHENAGHLTSNLGVGGSNPSERATFRGSVPDTWVTVYSGDMGNTFVDFGQRTPCFCRIACRRPCSCCWKSTMRGIMEPKESAWTLGKSASAFVPSGVL